MVFLLKLHSAYGVSARAKFLACAHRLTVFSLCLVLGFGLGGCASNVYVEKGMELIGFKKPELPPELEGVDLAKLALPRKVTLRIHAGQVLNVDSAGRPLSLVTRVYKLRSTQQFSQATYAMFTATGAEKPAFNEDVISVQEVVLTPGQKYEVVETMPTEATHIAVVSLFRSPDSQRWRFIFDSKAAAKTGVTLGAHACALSVSEGEAFGARPDSLRLAGMQCK